MSEKFVASNEVEVRIDSAGGLEFGAGGYATLAATTALREFFRHERDEELGRWRDPQNPDIVVYREPTGDDGDGRKVQVIDERTFTRIAAWESMCELGEGSAGRYFAAHPEPKPWHDAKPGEVWALGFSDQEGLLPYSVHADEHGPRFWWTGEEQFTPGRFAGEFAAGHRIWPEVSDVAE